MGAQLRVFRRRIQPVQSTKKITKAMELIAASRIVKAQQRVAGVDALRRGDHRGGHDRRRRSSSTEHPLLDRERENPAGRPCWSSPATAAWPVPTTPTCCARPSSSTAGCASEGMEPVPYVVGRKGVGYYRFRDREIGGELDRLLRAARRTRTPSEVADTLIEAFLHGDRRGRRRRDPHRLHRVRLDW